MTSPTPPPPPGTFFAFARCEAALHSWVAYGIMPLFALARAGVRSGGGALAPGGASIFIDEAEASTER
ncbi:Na+/H+ antiporter NhaA [Polyangium aurulentum]|nr:Na+/H+ antiporter NhaA [Polyangium aurulentum]